MDAAVLSPYLVLCILVSSTDLGKHFCAWEALLFLAALVGSVGDDSQFIYKLFLVETPLSILQGAGQ